MPFIRYGNGLKRERPWPSRCVIRILPPMVTQMVSVGESTGEMDTMLVKVADYYEDEVDVVVAKSYDFSNP